MDEFEMTESPGFFSRIFGRGRDSDVFDDDEQEVENERSSRPGTRNSSRMDVVRIHEKRYTICVRREMVTFDDAMAAAIAFKTGDQQILNLTQTEPNLRKTIADFLSGVAVGTGGSFDAVAPNVYVLSPDTAKVELLNSSTAPVAEVYGETPNWGM